MINGQIAPWSAGDVLLIDVPQPGGEPQVVAAVSVGPSFPLDAAECEARSPNRMNTQTTSIRALLLGTAYVRAFVEHY